MMVIWLALALDFLFGDPPNRFHPVAWLGQVVSQVEKYLPHKDARSDFLAGLVVWICGGGIILGLADMGERICRRFPFPIDLLAQALCLKLTISARGLTNAARQVALSLTDDLPKARRLLAWHLVSRDTSILSPSQVAAATIESVAENTSDGIIAPLFYYAIGGLRLAWLYRFANTLDSMWGYHDATHEWLGKAAARLDDLLNFIPARLSATFIVFSAWLRGENAAQALQTILQDAHQTASPNAGFPMSAMAGALEVELEKVGYYRLGRGLSKPNRQDIQRAIPLMTTGVILGGIVLSGLFMIKSRHTRF
ncbi:MAG: adenosylcobinamide-phosphate synthase CbiB [Anaerolineales bacterium]